MAKIYNTPQEWQVACGIPAGGGKTMDKILIDILYQLTLLNSGGGSGGNMIIFTTVAGQTAYVDPGLATWSDGLVIYGQMVLTPGQYNVDNGTSTITLVGVAVQDNKQLIIIKQ